MLKTCERHRTSEDEPIVIIYDDYSRDSSGLECPYCELATKKEQLEVELETTKELLQASNEVIETLQKKDEK
jgi:hypothetical protein